VQKFRILGVMNVCFITLPSELPFVPGHKKIKDSELCEKYFLLEVLRQHLLKMQVKLNTYHWGIQWNSMVMQVNEGDISAWEVVERFELKIDGMYQVQGSRHHRKYILYFHGKYTKKSKRLTVRATTDLFLMTLQLAERTPLFSTNCHIPLPCPLPVTVCRTTRRHIKRL